MPYIEALATRHDVTVIVPRVAYQSREQMGWNPTGQSPVPIIVAPTRDEVCKLFETPYEGRTIALFSGISAFGEVKRWFKLSLNYPLERGIITEAPYTYRFPLWMHKLRFLLQDYIYIKYINYVFAIGRSCEEYYRIWNGRWKIVPFDYCVAPLQANQPLDVVPNDKANFCFVGSMDKRKNVETLLQAFGRFAHKHREAVRQSHLTLVGDGPEKAKLEAWVKKEGLTKYITFTGVLPMDQARQVIAQSDVLVLPSLHDGWGAVVNEALMEGTVVYCSRTCGASVLIDAPSRGKTFPATDVKALARFFWNDYGFFLDAKKAEHRREALRQWALANIGPEAVAQRMENAFVRRRSKRELVNNE